MVGSIVFLIAAVIVLAGGLVELRESLAQRHRTLTPEVALARLKGSLDATAVLSWTGLAALTLITPALLRGVQLTLTNAGIVILALGMAAEQASYLVTRWSAMAHHRGPVLVGISALVTVGGLCVGLTL